MAADGTSTPTCIEDVERTVFHEESQQAATTPHPITVSSIPAAANRPELSLRFIDERQRQSSSKVRREVRSHVRRNTHMRQKRLNEASKPTLGQRRTLLKAAVEHPYDASTGIETQPKETLEMTEMSPDLSLSRWQFNNSTPYALLLDGNAPILQLSGNSWPFPQPISAREPAVSIWMPQAPIPIPNARSPRPCLLRSAQTGSWIANSVDYLSFKYDIMRWVNARLANPEDATSDMTIGVLICLMSWEITRSNTEELKLHVDGLSRIINLRGGSSDITNTEHFCWKIALIDLLVAILTGREPVFDFQLQEGLLRPPAINRSLGRTQKPDSPLYGSQAFAILLKGSQFSQDDVFLLQYVRELTNGIRRENLQDMKPLTESNLQNSSSIVSQMIHAASTIYGDAFRSPPIPFTSPNNADAVETISSCLEDTRNDETWTEFPGILLWIILTALAASIHRPQCSFFAMFAFRIGTSAAWWGPREAREAIMTFLDVKRRSEGRNSKRKRSNG